MTKALVPGQFYRSDELSLKEKSKMTYLGENVYVLPRVTRFGNIHPSLFDFLTFLNVGWFTVGHDNYNQLSFSTQVPARVDLYLERPIEINQKVYGNFFKVKPTPNQSWFKKFNRVEFMFFDSLIHFDSIIFDGYFEDTESLISGIVKRMNEVKKEGADLNRTLILDEAKKLRPDLEKYLSKSGK